MSEIEAYRSLVEEGQRLVRQEEDSKWGLGDLALEVEPVTHAGSHSGANDRLTKFAEDIGVEFETLRTYRMVAAAWPIGERSPIASWSVHKELSGRGDRLVILRALEDRAKSRSLETGKPAKPTIHDLRLELGKRPARGFEETKRGFQFSLTQHRSRLARCGRNSHRLRNARISGSRTLSTSRRAELCR